MIHPKQHVVKRLVSDNGGQHIFWKTRLAVAFPETEQESEFVYKTSPLGGKTPGTLAKKPLRLVVARTPVPYTLSSGWSGTYFLDTLSCGHQVTTYYGEESKRKRGCQECLDAQIAAKKYPHSVTSVERKSA